LTYNTHMPSSHDVLVVGGGVIGLTAAYFLAREGARVQVVDQSDFGRESSWAGAGILPPGDLRPASPGDLRPPLARLRALSAGLFPKLAAELHERTGMDNGYLRCGGLEFNGEDAAAAAEEWRGAGISCETLGGKALHKLEPALAPGLTEAYYLPDMAQVRNPRHVKALLAACQTLGVTLRAGCPVYGFERQGERVSAVHTARGSMPADKFLVAAGAWSDSLLGQVGWRPDIRPVRGQMALLNTGAPLFRRVLCRGKRYLVPRADGRVLVGSTEEDVGFDKRTTAQAIAGLLRLAVELVPGLATAHLERTWAGLRPGSPDGMPFLGAVPGTSNLFVAAGHFRAGIQLSPGTALVLKELILGQDLSVPLHGFALDRAISSRTRDK
jgi:glycine oxidase